jgi:hypothetical protein
VCGGGVSSDLLIACWAEAVILKARNGGGGYQLKCGVHPRRRTTWPCCASSIAGRHETVQGSGLCCVTGEGMSVMLLTDL